MSRQNGFEAAQRNKAALELEQRLLRQTSLSTPKRELHSLHEGNGGTASSQSNFDFSRIPVYATEKSPGSLIDAGKSVCPLISPSRCPYGGACHACPVQIQSKSAISQPGDSFEQEADQAAEQVMRMKESIPPSNSTIQRRSACSHEAIAGTRSAPVPSIVHEVLHSPGESLTEETLAFMEPRFGHNFRHVRIHTDENAAESARAVQAQAFTAGSHVVFGHGRYSPNSGLGRKLIAHELAHVYQQNSNLLLRTPDPEAVKEFESRIAALRKTLEFVKARKNPETRKELEEIIARARTRDNVLYYVEKLELLFSTPEENLEKQAKETSELMADKATVESLRLATKGKVRAGVEESISRDPGRVFTKKTSSAGVPFEIDARDLTNIAVKVKIRLVARGEGTKLDVGNIKQVEDAIEKNASTLGYSIDLEFVDKWGPDVFTAKVDPAEWTNAGNWVGEAFRLAHELHHLLGLDDLYDYIESHAGNPRMKIPVRIHWFRVQMDKTPDPGAGSSIMGRSTTGSRNLPSDLDVCRVAGLEGTSLDECIKARGKARQDKLQPAISNAFVGAFRAYENLSKIKSESGAEDPQSGGLKQRRALSIARNIFSVPVPLESLIETVSNMRWIISAPNIHLVSELSSNCSKIAFTVPQAPRIRLCPAFFDLGTREQADLLLREAAHFYYGTDGSYDEACPKSGCADACGDVDNAEAWVRFVRCASTI